MKNIFFLLIICCFITENVSSQNLFWAKSINVAYNDYVFDLQVDPDGNVVICGQFMGSVDFDPGPGTAIMTAAGGNGADIFIAKYDSSGNYMWSHSFGTGFFYDEGDRLAIDSTGNIFFTGFWNGTVDFNPDPGTTNNLTSGTNIRSRFLAKYDPAGNYLVAVKVGNAVGTLPSSQDAQTGLGCDNNGNVYMSGFYGTSLAIGPGTTLSVQGLSDNYISKFDPQLNLIWAHRIGGSGTEYSQGLYVHPSGKIISLGSFTGTVDFDPGPGTFNLTQTGNANNGYFASFDSSGNFVFVKQLEAGSSATPIATLMDSNENIIVTGSCAGTMDADPDTSVALVGIGFNDQAFVAAYDSTGKYRWAFAYGDIGSYQAIRYVSIDTMNSIYVAGTYTPWLDVDPGPDTATFGNKYGTFIAQYDTGGFFKTGFLQQEAKMRIHRNDIYLTGGYYGLVDFDPGPSVYNLQSDTANASWYLLRMHLCDNYTEQPGVISYTPVCAGDTFLLTVSQGGPDYLWDVTSGLTIVGPNNGDSLYVIIDPGLNVGMVTVQSIGGCLNSPLSWTSPPINHPVAPSIYQVSDTLFTSSIAVSYQWYLNNTLIPGATDSLYLPSVSGLYTVMITDTNGCTAISSPYNFVLSSVNENDIDNLKAYPNPFRNELNILIPEFLKSEITIRDLSGKIILTGQKKTNEQTILNTSFLSPGIYILQIRVAEAIRYIKITKM